MVRTGEVRPDDNLTGAYARNSSHKGKRKDKTKRNKVLGSLRFTYMIPAPKECIIKLDIVTIQNDKKLYTCTKEILKYRIAGLRMKKV